MFSVTAIDPGRDVQAGLDGAAPAARQIVVYEAGGSPYAVHYRETILPVLRRFAVPRGIGVRVVDVTRTMSDGPGLSEPISTVPTLVVFDDGREQGRITGLFALEDYMRVLGGLVRRD